MPDISRHQACHNRVRHELAKAGLARLERQA